MNISNSTGINYTTSMPGMEIPQQEVQSNFIHIFRIVLYPLVCLVGLIGNGLICFLAYKANKWRSTTEILILNLAISDLLVIVMFLPFDVVYVDVMHWKWPFGNFMCKLVNTLTDLSVIVSGTTLIFISCDRCRLIVNPMTTPFSRKTKMFIILVIWVYSILLVVPSMLSLNVNPKGECLADMSFYEKEEYLRLSYIFLIILPEFGIPFICVSICYIKIIYFLRRYHKEFKTLMMDGDVGSLKDTVAYRAKQNAKTLKILTGLVIAFTICTLPHQIIVLLVVFDKKYLAMAIMRQLYEFSRLLMTTNSCLNPLLYGGLSQKFKRSVAVLFKRKEKRGYSGLGIFTRSSTSKRTSTVRLRQTSYQSRETQQQSFH